MPKFFDLGIKIILQVGIKWRKWSNFRINVGQKFKSCLKYLFQKVIPFFYSFVILILESKYGFPTSKFNIWRTWPNFFWSFHHPINQTNNICILWLLTGIAIFDFINKSIVGKIRYIHIYILLESIAGLERKLGF